MHSNQELLPAIHLSDLDSVGLRHFVDAHGRQRILHGVNAVVKGPPWHPSVDGFDVDTSLCDHDFAILQEAGVTVIRLGVMWPGVEPERGQYNTTYIDIMRGIAENAAKFGIYTLLDMHQDVMSEKFCGEGIPLWAVKPSGSFHFPEPVTYAYSLDPSTGLPRRQDCKKKAWSDYYFSEATGTAFQALYDNHDGLLDAWAAMWAKVTASFKGSSHILGVELINEPWAGDVVHNPTLLVPTKADKQNLQHCYDQLAKAVWDADPDRLVFFSGVTWADYGNGFSAAPAGVAARSVLSYHYYEFPAGPQVKGSSWAWVSLQVEEARRLGTGAMLTEFGEPDGPFSPGAFAQTTGAAEAAGHSWACWEYKTFCTPPSPSSSAQNSSWGACKTGYGGAMWDKNGGVVERAYRQLGRPYATAVAGELQAAVFDETANTLSLRYLPAANASAPTVIRAPLALRYPHGFSVAISPPAAATWTQHDPSTLLVSHADTPLPAVIVVTLSPQSPSLA